MPAKKDTWCYAHKNHWRPQTVDAQPTGYVACMRCGALHPEGYPPYKHERRVDSPGGAKVRRRLRDEIGIGAHAESGD